MIDRACGCCFEPEGHAAALVNRPGLSAIAFRAGTQQQFLQRMRAALSTNPTSAIAKLKARNTDDFAIALLDAWASVAAVIAFYQERLANEAYLRTAVEHESVLQLARLVGYSPRPGVAAATYLTFHADAQVSGDAPVPVPVATKVQSVPRPGETAQVYETTEPLIAFAWLNELRLRSSERILPEADADEVILHVATGTVTPAEVLAIVRRGTVTVRRILRRVEESRERLRFVLERGRVCTGAASLQDGVYAFRVRQPLAGSTAPEWRSLSEDTRRALMGTSSGGTGPDWPPPEATTILDLEGEHTEIDAGGPVVVIGSRSAILAEVRQRRVLTRSRFMVTGRVTALLLSQAVSFDSFSDYRSTMVFARPAVMQIEPVAVTRAATGQILLLDTASAIPAGRMLLVSSAAHAEHVEVAGSSTTGGVTSVQLRSPLRAAYPPQHTRVFGNVTAATHGEAVHEVLGDGDPGVPDQRFRLREQPLTYTMHPHGARSSLSIAVDGITWREAPFLFGRGPGERVFETRLDAGGHTVVQFGDGEQGARPPAGTGNVRATYRQGSGLAGLVAAHQLTQLLDRPLGITAVDNPVAAIGAMDSERLEDARANAPNTIRHFDRVVSLADYEWFAGSFPGIGKARAAWIWDAGQKSVRLSVVGATVRDPVVREEAVRALASALRAVGDPFVRVRIVASRVLFAEIAARIDLLPEFDASAVVSHARAQLRDQFSFAARSIGQPIARSEVIAALHAINGVKSVRIDRFAFAAAPFDTSELLRGDGNEVIVLHPDRIDVEALT